MFLTNIYVYSPQRKEIEQIDRGQNLQSNKETFSYQISSKSIFIILSYKLTVSKLVHFWDTVYRASWLRCRLRKGQDP